MTTSKQEMIDKANELLAAAALLPDDKPKPWPQEGDVCWTLFSEGDVCWATYKGQRPEKGRIAQGNIFKTEAEAIRKREVNAATVKVLARTKELNDGWVPDFSDKEQRKYLPTLYAGELVFEVFREAQSRPASHYLKSSTLAALLIKERPDDFRLMLEG